MEVPEPSYYKKKYLMIIRFFGTTLVLTKIITLRHYVAGNDDIKLTFRQNASIRMRLVSLSGIIYFNTLNSIYSILSLEPSE